VETISEKRLGNFRKRREGSKDHSPRKKVVLGQEGL